MRPIKFRGRDIDTGEFVYGDFGRAANTGEPVIYFIDDERNWVGATVDEDSIAQLVGYDADGREVYEDDELVNAANETITAILLEGIYTEEGFIHPIPLECLKLKEVPKP